LRNMLSGTLCARWGERAACGMCACLVGKPAQSVGWGWACLKLWRANRRASACRLLRSGCGRQLRVGRRRNVCLKARKVSELVGGSTGSGGSVAWQEACMRMRKNYMKNAQVCVVLLRKEVGQVGEVGRGGMVRSGMGMGGGVVWVGKVCGGRWGCGPNLAFFLSPSPPFSFLPSHDKREGVCSCREAGGAATAPHVFRPSSRPAFSKMAQQRRVSASARTRAPVVPRRARRAPWKRARGPRPQFPPAQPGEVRQVGGALGEHGRRYSPVLVSAIRCSPTMFCIERPCMVVVRVRGRWFVRIKPTTPRPAF